MAEHKKSQNGFSPKKLSNLKVVVLCVAAATTFWILNALNKDDYTTIVDFPIEFLYNQDRYMAVEPLPESIQIEISGNGWDLLRKYFNINSTPYTIELDNPVSRTFVLTNEIKRSLGEFLTPTQLVSIVDDSVYFRIDQIKTVKLKPVLDSTSYSLAKNFRLLQDPEFSPALLTVKGPTSILEIFEGLYPIKLDEEKINQDIEKVVNVEVTQELEEFISIQAETVSVKLELLAFLEGNKRLKVKKINFPRTVSLETDEPIIMMYYLVDERRTEDLKEIEFEAILDYSKRNRQDSTISVQVIPMPSYLDQVRVEPALLQLIYEQP